MRTVIIMLLLAVCFLLGVIYANGQPPDFEKHTNEKQRIAEIEEAQDSYLDEDNEANSSTETAYVDKAPGGTEKVAASLEKVVTGFYDMVVELMYGFSEVFF